MKNSDQLAIIKIFLIIITFFITTVPSMATTVSVGPDLEDDYSTIQAAVNGMSNGDTIIVKNDTYNENVTVYKSVTIRSENGYENTIVEVLDSSLDGFLVTADNVTIEGFTIYGANDSGKAGILLSDVSNCSITDNRCGYKFGEEVRDNYYGIVLSGATACTVDNNICNYNDWYGIWIPSLSTSNMISNNSCNANFVSGIFVAADSNTILSNTCREHFISGISINGSGNIVERNTCTENGDGIALQGTNGIVKNNISSNNNYSGVYGNQIDDYSIYYNSCLSNQTGMSLNKAENNLIILNDFNGNSSSNINSSLSINSWASPVKIWYQYDDPGGTLDPPYASSFMGNYYSDHVLVDADIDGICDSSYDLPDTEPDDDFPLFETTVNYGKDIDCYWDGETIGEDILVLGDLTISGSLTITGSLTLGSI